MRQKGFTLLEVLLTVVILAIIVTIITFSFSRLNSQQALDKSADLVVAILDEARSLSLSSAGDSQYGVFLEDSQVALFKGPVYSSSDPSNIVSELNDLIGLRNVSLVGGGSSVVFNRLTGYTDEEGSLELFLKASPETIRTINISATGVVELD